MKEVVNMLIDRLDFAIYSDYCRMIQILFWNMV